MANTKLKKAADIQYEIRKFLTAMGNRPVHVAGMWCGNFTGRAVSIGVAGAEFSIDKPDSGKPGTGEILWLPYCTTMIIKEAPGEVKDGEQTVSDVPGV